MRVSESGRGRLSWLTRHVATQSRTPVAAVLLARGGILGMVLAVAAVDEYVVDVLPNTPSRTQAMGLRRFHKRLAPVYCFGGSRRRSGQVLRGRYDLLSLLQGRAGTLVALSKFLDCEHTVSDVPACLVDQNEGVCLGARHDALLSMNVWPSLSKRQDRK